MQTGETARKDLNHVRDHRAVRRGDEADSRRKSRQRSLSRLLEKALGGTATINLKPNAWFEFFAPRGAPEISGAIMAEHGGYGAAAAVPVGKFVLDTYFAKKDGKPLPVWPKTPDTAAAATTAAPKPPVAARR